MRMVAKGTSCQIRLLLNWEIGRDMLSNLTVRTFNIFLYENKYECRMVWNLNVSLRLGVCTCQSSPEEQNQQKLYPFFKGIGFGSVEAEAGRAGGKKRE